MARKFLVSRVALAIALTGGLAVSAAQPAMAAKKDKKAESTANFSDAFRTAAAPIEKAMTEATSKLPSPPQPADLATAKASMDAALGGNAKGAFDAAVPTATTPDDKNALGSMMRNYGIISQDLVMKQQGTKMMLDSGKVPAESVGAMNFDAGVTAYQAKDYAGAATYLKAAKDAGYTDPNNQLDAVLADAYKRSGNAQAALQMTQQEIDAAKANGKAPSETALRTALQQSYDAKQLDKSTEYAAMLGQYYPGAWNVALAVVRQLASLPRDQNLDLMRLMFVTNAMADKRDYLEYLENVDPRAYPGEALKVINDGVSKGKLTEADIGPDKSNTSARVASDKASLPATANDAMKANASVGTVTGAGDVFLSYDDPAKAETFYTKAMGMPGADASKVALRLGMAQAMQGKYAEAETTLAKVTGTRAPVAKMWIAYAKSKASPAPAAATAPAATR